MPFEPAPKESPAARLAALIELGRVMNPDLKQGRGAFLQGLEACAIGFAALACGADRKKLDQDLVGHNDFCEAVRALGVKGSIYEGLYLRIQRLNDRGVSLNAICFSLREGELAKVTA